MVSKWFGERLNVDLASPLRLSIPKPRHHPDQFIRRLLRRRQSNGPPIHRLPATLLGTACTLMVGGFLFIAAAVPVAAATPSAAQGEQVFRQHCAGCHGVNGQGGFQGPSLHDLPPGRDTILGVEDVVIHGLPDMPKFGGKLSDAQIAAVATYVVDHFSTLPDIPAGGSAYRLNCAGCHGVTLRGGALINNDTNAPSLENVPAAYIAGAVRGGFGTMPAFNEAALSDKEVASIAAYVETIQKAPTPGGFELFYPGPVSEGLIAIVAGLGAAVLAAVWVERGGRG